MDSPKEASAARPHGKINLGGPQPAGSVAAWVQQFVRTLKTCRLYDGENPTVIKFREDLALDLKTLLKKEGPLTLRFTSNDVFHGDVSTYPARSREDNLAQPFYRDGIRSITFEPNIEIAEVESLLDQILRVTGPASSDEDLVTLLWDADIAHMKIDCAPQTLEVDSAAGAWTDTADQAALWPKQEERRGRGHSLDSHLAPRERRWPGGWGEGIGTGGGGGWGNAQGGSSAPGGGGGGWGNAPGDSAAPGGGGGSWGGGGGGGVGSGGSGSGPGGGGSWGDSQDGSFAPGGAGGGSGPWGGGDGGGGSGTGTGGGGWGDSQDGSSGAGGAGMSGGSFGSGGGGGGEGTGDGTTSGGWGDSHGGSSAHGGHGGGGGGSGSGTGVGRGGMGSGTGGSGGGTGSGTGGGRGNSQGGSPARGGAGGRSGSAGGAFVQGGPNDEGGAFEGKWSAPPGGWTARDGAPAGTGAFTGSWASTQKRLSRLAASDVKDSEEGEGLLRRLGASGRGKPAKGNATTTDAPAEDAASEDEETSDASTATAEDVAPEETDETAPEGDQGRSDDWKTFAEAGAIESVYVQMDRASSTEVDRLLREFHEEQGEPAVRTALTVISDGMAAHPTPEDRLDLGRFLPQVLREAIRTVDWHSASESLALLRECEPPDWSVHAFTSDLLGSFKTVTPQCVAALDHRVKEDLEPFLSFARELGPESVEWLMTVLSLSQQKFVRRPLTRVLSDHCRDNPARLKPWLSTKEWYVVRNVVHIWGWIGGSTVVELMRDAVDHAEPRVRQEVVAVLGQVDRASARPILLGMLDGAPARLFATVLHQLSQERDTEVAHKLLEYVLEAHFGERPNEVRRAIAAALAACGGEEVLPSIEHVLFQGGWISRSSDPKQRALARCLARIGGPAAHDLLRRGARSWRPAVRKACGEVLAGIRTDD